MIQNNQDTIGDLLTKRPEQAVVLAGRYKIVRKLGEGGMGSVWLAEDQKLDGRKVAIKMLPVVLATNARAIQQLKAEAKVAMQLVHSNIVALRSFEDSDEGAFLVMDYVPGKTLEQILAEKETLSEEEVLRIFKPVAEALDYAHRHKVVHRDVKPSNVIVNEAGEPFIMDFGIAREMKDTMTRVTGKNSSGTLPYMSPEQLRGEEPAPAQDVYSLAATIYECLSGNPPFHRGQIEHQIEHVAPKPLAAHSPLGRAVMAGLAKTPEGRPTTAGKLVEGGRVEPQRAQRAQRGGPKGWKWAAGLVLVAGLSAAGWGVWRSIQDSGVRSQNGSDGAGTPPPQEMVGPGGDRAGLEQPPGQRPGLQQPEQPPNEGVGAPKAEAPAEPAVDYEALVDLKAQAEQKWQKVQRLDAGQGFGAAIEKCEVQINAALDCFNDEPQRPLAMKKYEAVAAECDRLLGLDGERQAAARSRDKAMQARTDAQEAGAEADAKVLWTNAGLLMQQAAVDFEKPDFGVAQKNWTAAAGKYAEAKDAAAAAKAERDAQEQAAAEAKRKADETAAAKKAAEEAARQPKVGDIKKLDLGGGVTLDLAWIPAGTFTMGSPAGEAERIGNEGPQHEVRFAQGFWMGQTEVTQAQYEQVTGGNPSNWKGANLPVENVSWNDAKEFCRKASQTTGQEVRLPSEAEWEYACRAGTTTPFHYGDSLDATMANFDGNYPYGNGRKGEYRQRTTAVKSFRPNAWGLYDMHGNVWEWCEDGYHDSYNGAPRDGSPWLSPAGSYRVLRGGSWYDDARYCRSAYRSGFVPVSANFNFGFRVVLSR